MVTTEFIADVFAVTITSNAVHDFVLYISHTTLSLLSLIMTISSESGPTGLLAIQLILNWNPA